MGAGHEYLSGLSLFPPLCADASFAFSGREPHCGRADGAGAYCFFTNHARLRDQPFFSGFDGGGGIFSSSAERDFWTLFNAYPRKENPACALRVWLQYRLQGAMPPPDTLTAAVEANKRNNPTWTKEGGRYVPYLVNWLCDCRWNDEFSRPTHPMREQEGEAQAQSVGSYETAEPGWCYLRAQAERRENALPGSAREETPEAIDPEFEAIWGACPFEPGPRVVSYGFWKGLKRQNKADVERLLTAVSNAPRDYDRQLWRFLGEQLNI